MPNETTDTGSTDSDAIQDVSTGGDTAAVDLQDLVDDYREEVERLRDLKERVEGDDEESGDDDEEVEWPPAEWAGVDHPIRAAEHAAELVEAEIGLIARQVTPHSLPESMGNVQTAVYRCSDKREIIGQRGIGLAIGSHGGFEDAMQCRSACGLMLGL